MDFFSYATNLAHRQLNEVQKEAVMECDRPLLLVSAPGTGKTTVIAFKVFYLNQVKKYPFERILALTFSKDATGDMEERFSTFFGSVVPQKVGFSTIHRFCYQVLRQEMARQGIHYELIEGQTGTTVNKHQLIKQLFQTLEDRYPTEEEQEEILLCMTQAKNLSYDDPNLTQVRSEYPNFVTLYQAYETYKKTHVPRLVDYDDMLSYTYELFKDNPLILKKYQDKFDYVLVDEAQDTSAIQYEIVHLLTKTHQRVCFVGDDAQSIYRFRGSLIEKMMELPKKYPTMNVLRMEQNYRSKQEIVTVANQFIQKNKGFQKNMFTTNDSGGTVRIELVDTYEDQLHFLISEIKKNPEKEIAILYRNNVTALPLVYKLQEEGISYQASELKGKKMSYHPVFMEFRSMLALAEDNTNRSAFLQVAKRSKLYLTQPVYPWLEKNHQIGESIWEALARCPLVEPWQQESVRAFQTLIERVRNLNNQEGLTQWLQYARYDGNKKGKDGEVTSEKNVEWALLLLQLVTARYSLTDSVARLDTFFASIGATNDNEANVILTTLHRSKGLEYEQVYLIDLQQGVLPSSMEIKEKEEGNPAWYEESVRLFYVGMTRAKDSLCLVAYTKQQGKKVQPSEFIYDVHRLLKPVGVKAIPTTAKQPTKQDIHHRLLTTTWKHKRYGVGKVVEMKEDGDTILFELEDGRQKQLSLVICLKNKLLTMVS